MVVAITKTESNTNKMQGTCVVTAVNVRICLDFDALWRSHPLNWKPILRFPFQKKVKSTRPKSPLDVLRDDPDHEWVPIYSDQCAIKMSVALDFGGFPLDTFPKNRSEVREVHGTNRMIRAALAAEELANWLNKALGQALVFEGSNKSRDAIMGKKGIVFFKDFWVRDGEATPQGDHIDLWDGSRTPNQLAVTFSMSVNIFTRCKEVWFWEIKS